MSTPPAADPAGSLAVVPVPPDVPALAGVAQGDPDAIDRLWALYAQRIRALGLNLSGYDPTFADDLVQETFARLWRSAGPLRPGTGAASRPSCSPWPAGPRWTCGGGAGEPLSDESLDLTDGPSRAERAPPRRGAARTRASTPSSPAGW